MISLKKALAGISMLAIIVIAFSCHNNSSSDFIDGNGNNSNGSTGEVAGNGISFDLSNAKSFFAGNASTATASRSAARSIYDDNNTILMKITDDGTILPAMDSQASNIDFRLEKILKNPATKELFLLGNFNKWSDGSDNGWSYSLIKVAQDGKWYGLPNFWFSITQEPFDESGNFYFNYNGDIYKYSGSTATKIVENAELKRVLPNGAIVYTVSISSLNSTTYYTYVKLRDGTPVRLDDYSTSIYIKDKNILYYYIKYIPKDETTYYVDDEGNKYYPWDIIFEQVWYANKGGKKIYVTEVDGRWQDENGKTYNEHVFSGYENNYWTIDDAGNKIYLTYFPYYYKDNDGNKYYDEDVFYDDENHYSYAFKDGKKIEVEYISSYYEDAQGTKYVQNVKSESNYMHWIYEGGEFVKVKYNNSSYRDNDGNYYSEYYQDEDGNKYAYYKVYSDYEDYVTVNGKKVKVTPAENYSTDTIVAKYYDFIANEKKEVVTEANFSNLSLSFDFTTSSENVLGTTFITNYLWKFEMQSDFSLKCTYNLSEKGYTVATTWNSYYNFIGENNTRYLEKFLYNGDKIYFLGTQGSSWSSDASYNLYRIVRFGDPQPVLSSADASNYAFNGDITFDDDGNFIGSVLRKSDSKCGILSGSMEYGTYDFQENNIFESVTDIVINFD